jgi:hypothetical protein
MRIGVDFDNTIVCYDGAFQRGARDLGLVSEDLFASKNAVRDYFNNAGRRDEFTALQGYVYGARMDLASCYPGVKDFIRAATSAEHELYVVSHKTRNPLLGPKYDLHAAARNFLHEQDLVRTGGLRSENIFFALTKEEKVAKIADLNCQVFIDDLPEILAMVGFPKSARAILFDPDGHHAKDDRFERFTNWRAIASALLGAAQ